MTSAKQLERKTVNSFKLVKQDIYSLYETMSMLMQEVESLKIKHDQLNRKVYLGKSVNRTIVKKVGKRKYVGSKSGSKVHVSTCAFAANIKPKNKKVFSSKNAALNEGYKACACA